MVILRCTRKLLDRIGIPVAGAQQRSNNVLGDWYATLLFTRPQQLVLAVCENARLPVLVAARELATLNVRFADSVALVLQNLDIRADAINRERAAMQDLVIGATQNRSLLGSINDFAFHVQWQAASMSELTLPERSLALASIPLAPLGYRLPRDVAQELFARASTDS